MLATATSAADNPSMSNEREPDPAWEYAQVYPRRERTGILKTVLTVLFVGFVIAAFLPDSARLLLPEGWRSRLPRLQFGNGGSGAPQGPLAGADSTLDREPEPAESSAAAKGDFPLAAISTQESVHHSSPKPVRTASNTRPRRSAHRVAPPPEPVQEWDESPDMQYVRDSPVTIIPVRVTTEVQLAGTPVPGPVGTPAVVRPVAPLDSPTSPDAASADSTADEDWPLLCGQVFDAHGAPIEGASVELESPHVTVTSDPQGRFCFSCPAGERIVRIDAGGRGRATHAVTLKRSMFDLRIALAQTP
jgi:hypothetical protein